MYCLNTFTWKWRAGFVFIFFFPVPDCWCLFTGIVVHQLWSSAFSRKLEVWAPVAGASRFCCCCWATGMVPPLVLVPYANRILYILVSFMSHRPDRKGTLASDLKGAGAWIPPTHPRARHWILNCIQSPKFAVWKLLQTVLEHNFKNIYLLFYLHWKCKCFIFAGPNIYSQSLAVLSGELSLPFNITTTGHQMFLRWSSDHGTNKKGFRVTYVGEYQSMYPRLVIPFSSMCVSHDLLSVLPMTCSSKSVSICPSVCVQMFVYLYVTLESGNVEVA